jgi:hypothetical protein
LFAFSCDKELNITDFKEDFGGYEAELKIEGLLQGDKPEDSVIRIIKTSPVTETDVFNGKDDDYDGEIDEYDEVLPQVQDTSAIVTVVDLETGEAYDFHYVSAADSFFYSDDEEEFEKLVSYGGYKPGNNFVLKEKGRYRLEIYSSEFDQTIIGETVVPPAVKFIDTLFNFQGDLIRMKSEDKKEIFWKSEKNITAYYITYEELIAVGDNKYFVNWLYSYKSTVDYETTKNYNNVSIGRELIWGFNQDTFLRITVEAISPAYGRYMFSSLPLNDPNKSNLRDEEDNIVMGCFGASTAASIFIKIEE